MIGFFKYIGISLYIRNIGIFQMEITKNALIWRSRDVKNTKFGIPDIWMDVPKRTKEFCKFPFLAQNGVAKLKKG